MKKPNHRRRPFLRARSERPNGGRPSNNFYEITPAHATIRPQSETLDNASCAKSITDWGAGVSCMSAEADVSNELLRDSGLTQSVCIFGKIYGCERRNTIF